MKAVSLFIDESGDANPRVVASPTYILAGCMIDENARERLKIEADQVKFKFWSRTDIVFHSREIGRKEGEFKILTDRSCSMEFNKDLFGLLNRNAFQMLFVVVDKKEALLQNWHNAKVYEDSARIMVKNFILALLSQGNIRGRMVVESASSEKDFYFHKAAGHFLSRGMPELNISFSQVQSVLTEIAFVTKRNHDTEEQVADLLAYAGRLKQLKKAQSTMTAYEKGVLSLLESKLFKMHPQTGDKKKKYQSQIESFKVIP